MNKKRFDDVTLWANEYANTVPTNIVDSTEIRGQLAQAYKLGAFHADRAPDAEGMMRSGLMGNCMEDKIKALEATIAAQDEIIQHYGIVVRWVKRHIDKDRWIHSTACAALKMQEELGKEVLDEKTP